MECPEGTHYRKSYIRASYVNKRGARVKAIRVDESCVSSPSRKSPSRRSPSRKSPNKRFLKGGKVSLSAHGYSTYDTKQRRQAALMSAVDFINDGEMNEETGYRKVYNTLKGVLTLQRNRGNEESARAILNDMKFIRSKYQL